MTMNKRILFLGESYTASYTYYRGADFVTLPEYANTGSAFCDMLRGQGFLVEQLCSHEVAQSFPLDPQVLQAYNAVILSDIGSNTMLSVPPSMRGQRIPNRLELLRQYVENGGGLLMCGGYFGFSGVNNTARYGMTPLADALSVNVLHYDDRIESPEGVVPRVLLPNHPILRGVAVDSWPDFRGYNRVTPKSGAETIACFGADPFLVAARYGKGRSFSFTSDCEPNWATQAFLNWPSYPVLFHNILDWLSGEK